MKTIEKHPDPKGGVQADYYFGDVQRQSAMLSDTINRQNAAIAAAHIKAGGNPEAVPGLIDKGAAINAMVRRVKRHYGLTSKYDGKGNLR